MKHRTILFAAACAGALALGGCMEDGYTRTSVGVGIGWQSYPYDVWYDGYYGPFYDGYWGTDGFFYYRLLQNDRVWHRGDAGHFGRNPPPNWNDHRNDGGRGGDRNWRQYQGRSHQPPQGATVPQYPGWGTGPGGNQNHGRSGDRQRDPNRH